mgnify:CR=1 FL=1
MKRLFILFILLYQVTFGQISITEIDKQTVKFSEVKFGAKIGVTMPYADLYYENSNFYMLNEKAAAKINLGIHCSTRLTKKIHLCIEMLKFNSMYEFKTGLSQNALNSEFLPADFPPHLESNYKYSQLLISPSIRVELIDDFRIGLGITFNRISNQELNIESIEYVSPMDNSINTTTTDTDYFNTRVNISPKVYLNYFISDNIIFEVDYLFNVIEDYEGNSYNGSVDIDIPAHPSWDYFRENMIGKASLSLIYLIKT